MPHAGQQWLQQFLGANGLSVLFKQVGAIHSSQKKKRVRLNFHSVNMLICLPDIIVESLFDGRRRRRRRFQALFPSLRGNFDEETPLNVGARAMVLFLVHGDDCCIHCFFFAIIYPLVHDDKRSFRKKLPFWFSRFPVTSNFAACICMKH